MRLSDATKKSKNGRVSEAIKSLLLKNVPIRITGVGVLETFKKKARRYYCTHRKKVVVSIPKKSIHFRTSRTMLRDLNDR